MTSHPTGGDDDPARDAHLRAALRHAPDRDARPPAELSRRILDAARAAALSSAKTTARPATGSWARVRAWLASSIEGLRHPGATAAFASLMLATVIGVMWRDGPPPGTEPVHESAAPAAPSTAPSASAAAPAPAADRPPARRDEPAEAAAAVAARDAAATTARRADDDGARREAAAPRPRTTAPAPSDPPAQKAAAQEKRNAAPEAAAPPAASPPPPATTATTPAPSVAPPDRARAAAQTHNQAPAPLGAAAEHGGLDERQSTQTTPPDDPLAAPIAALRGSGGGALARLARRAEADAAAPSSAAAMLPSALAWFGDAQTLTRGQWRPVAATAAAVVPAAWTEALSADGRALGRVAILDGALWWQPAGEDGRAWRAPLPAGSAAQRLGEALASGALDRPPSRP
ncbi:hypothetical protein [Methylibium sp.]|uniref:hypothetical protein n=1 Tax=Methylibium sp. TaxID=2067992 RepID=UPI003D0E8204